MKQQKRKTKVMFLIPFVVLALITLGSSLLYDAIVNGTRETGEEETAEAETVELELTYAYQNSQWNAAIVKMIHGFEEEHPEIDVQYEINYEDNVYEDLLSKRIARGELGDIVQLKTPETYAASGLLAAIPEEVAGAVSNVYAYRDQVCGVGAVESTWGILYNRSLFASYGLDEPETYEDFLEICGFLQRRDITPIGVGGADLWHMEFWVNHFFRTDVLAQDGDWLKKCAAGEVPWTDEAPARMMAHLGQLFENRYVNGDWITATDTSLSYKMAGEEIAMVYTGPWTAETVQKLNPDMELGWFYVPDENGTVRASDNLDTFWSITAACAEDPEKYGAAVAFLEYFYSGDAYAQFCEDSATFPLTGMEPQYGEDSLLGDAWGAFTLADQRVSTYIGNEDTPQEFERSMLEIVRKTLDGDCSREEGLRQIQQAWERSSEGGRS